MVFTSSCFYERRIHVLVSEEALFDLSAGLQTVLSDELSYSVTSCKKREFPKGNHQPDAAVNKL